MPGHAAEHGAGTGDGSSTGGRGPKPSCWDKIPMISSVHTGLSSLGCKD